LDTLSYIILILYGHCSFPEVFLVHTMFQKLVLLPYSDTWL